MLGKKMKKISTYICVAAIVALSLSACTNKTTQPNKTNTNKSSKVTKENTKKTRTVQGKAVDLGAGTFTGGKDVAVGLYDVTPVEGTGNFTVTSKGTLLVNEILGSAGGLGVSKVRVRIANNDEIKLQNINKTHFEPVTSAFVTAASQVSIYSGEWTVGEDVAAGRYKAAAASGTGNFVVYQSGMPITNEILGSSGVKEVTVNLKDGDIIKISNLNQVNLTPSK